MNNKDKYITDISVGKAIRASSSFTAVFSPCEYKDHAFIDGGALDNIPVEEVKKQGADIVIGVKFNSERINEDSNIMDMTMKTIDIMGEKISEEEINPLTETSDNETDITEELPSIDFLSTPDGVTNVSTVNSISQMNLQLNNILNIILIAIGVLLILFAIAILIRLKS